MIVFQQTLSTEVTLPLLGMREDGSAFFQYLLNQLTVDTLQGSIPSWVVQQDRLETGDRVRPNLPFNVEGHFLDRGEVTHAEWDKSEDSLTFKLHLQPTDVTGIPVHLLIVGRNIILRGNSQPNSLLLFLVKDSFLLKRGIGIYLKHLYPFFFRRGEYPHGEYQGLKDTVLNEVHASVIQNAANFEKLAREFQNNVDDPFLHLDLETLRAWSIPEIQPDLFRLTFGSDTVEQYLSAILSLNQRLLLNYNTITLLYASQIGI